MQIFEFQTPINRYSFACMWEKTRSGFRHVCHVLRNGHDIREVKVNYLNRTWERYDFQTVLFKAIATLREQSMIPDSDFEELYNRIKEGE
jgi:hypothetical protein